MMNHLLAGMSILALTSTVAMSAGSGPGPGPGGEEVEPEGPQWPTSTPNPANADFYLDDDSESLQDAIDDAQDWDVIVLGIGTWTGPFDLKGKHLWIFGYGGSVLLADTEGTIMSTEGTSSDTAWARFTNVAFQVESGQSARAIEVTHTMLELAYCTFEDFERRAPGPNESGGAVKATDSDVVAIDCDFFNCEAMYGGALDVTGGDLALTRCFLADCVSAQGGAVRVEKGELATYECRFEDNEAQFGGAVYGKSLDAAVFRRTIFSENSATATTTTPCGGAIWINSGLEVHACVFTSNSAERGGAVYATQGVNALTVSHSRFTSNTSSDGLFAFRCGGLTMPRFLRTRFCDNGTQLPIAGTGAHADKMLLNDGNESSQSTYADVTGCWVNASEDGATCVTDVDLSGKPEVSDLLQMLEDWGVEGTAVHDYNDDFELDSADLMYVLFSWGECVPEDHPEV